MLEAAFTDSQNITTETATALKQSMETIDEIILQKKGQAEADTAKEPSKLYALEVVYEAWREKYHNGGGWKSKIDHSGVRDVYGYINEDKINEWIGEMNNTVHTCEHPTMMKMLFGRSGYRRWKALGEVFSQADQDSGHSKFDDLKGDMMNIIDCVVPMINGEGSPLESGDVLRAYLINLGKELLDKGSRNEAERQLNL